MKQDIRTLKQKINDAIMELAIAEVRQVLPGRYIKIETVLDTDDVYVMQFHGNGINIFFRTDTRIFYFFTSKTFLSIKIEKVIESECLKTLLVEHRKMK